ATICRMLGGMPLAILLVAAWVDTLTLQEIRKEIENGLGLLKSNLIDIPERHRNITGLFDYSLGMLTSHEQAVFMRLGVFRGGFTREAAQVIAGAQLHDIQRLVQTAFIQHQLSGRYV